MPQPRNDYTAAGGMNTMGSNASEQPASQSHRLWHWRRSLWRRHPGVRSGERLTLGERAADRLRNGMGSWTFVLVALVFLAAWMTGNGRHGFDP